MSDSSPSRGPDDEHADLIRQYVAAVLGAAVDAGPVEPALDELEDLVADVWEGQPGFAALVASPAVSAAEKQRILDQAIGDTASPLVRNVLRVLNSRDRLGLLPAITRGARATWDHKQGRRYVTVRSAVPLDEAQLHALRDRLRTLIGGEPILHAEVDPALVGGLVIQAGDTVYDASIRTLYLDHFRRRLVEGRAHDVLARPEAFTTS
jgi:F-type H+-transporting ATPase subunit delta